MFHEFFMGNRDAINHYLPVPIFALPCFLQTLERFGLQDTVIPIVAESRRHRPDVGDLAQPDFH
jgi:hypothetical protein